MNRTRILGVSAVCASIALFAAGCGDDDSSSVDSTPVVTVAGATSPSVVAPASGAVATVPAGSAAAATGTSDPDLVADCAAVEAAFTNMDQTLSSIPEPNVGDEIAPETADAMGGVVSQLDGLDVQTDAVREAIDQYKGAFQSISEGGTFTQDVADQGVAAGQALATACAGLIGG